mmetsp:Transcript_20952/g.53057  ORF Transcript_20952/g.53057 Transcript_20952/m.53057 type:complete len:967 (-) Transcript_20952:32-2932(-)
MTESNSPSPIASSSSTKSSKTSQIVFSEKPSASSPDRSASPRSGALDALRHTTSLGYIMQQMQNNTISARKPGAVLYCGNDQTIEKALQRTASQRAVSPSRLQTTHGTIQADRTTSPRSERRKKESRASVMIEWRKDQTDRGPTSPTPSTHDMSYESNEPSPSGTGAKGLDKLDRSWGSISKFSGRALSPSSSTRIPDRSSTMSTRSSASKNFGDTMTVVSPRKSRKNTEVTTITHNPLVRRESAKELLALLSSRSPERRPDAGTNTRIGQVKSHDSISATIQASAPDRVGVLDRASTMAVISGVDKRRTEMSPSGRGVRSPTRVEAISPKRPDKGRTEMPPRTRPDSPPSVPRRDRDPSSGKARREREQRDERVERKSRRTVKEANNVKSRSCSQRDQLASTETLRMKQTMRGEDPFHSTVTCGYLRRLSASLKPLEKKNQEEMERLLKTQAEETPLEPLPPFDMGTPLAQLTEDRNHALTIWQTALGGWRAAVPSAVKEFLVLLNPLVISFQQVMGANKAGTEEDARMLLVAFEQELHRTIQTFRDLPQVQQFVARLESIHKNTYVHICREVYEPYFDTLHARKDKHLLVLTQNASIERANLEQRQEMALRHLKALQVEENVHLKLEIRRAKVEQRTFFRQWRKEQAKKFKREMGSKRAQKDKGPEEFGVSRKTAREIKERAFKAKDEADVQAHKQLIVERQEEMVQTVKDLQVAALQYLRKEHTAQFSEQQAKAASDLCAFVVIAQDADKSQRFDCVGVLEGITKETLQSVDEFWSSLASAMRTKVGGFIDETKRASKALSEGQQDATLSWKQASWLPSYFKHVRSGLRNSKRMLKSLPLTWKKVVDPSTNALTEALAGLHQSIQCNNSLDVLWRLEWPCHTLLWKEGGGDESQCVLRSTSLGLMSPRTPPPASSGKQPASPHESSPPPRVVSPRRSSTPVAMNRVVAPKKARVGKKGLLPES